jgi:guanine nucleotide-binding protein subunit beta-2-like 1 protein
MADQSSKQYAMMYKGSLKGHNGWVTAMQLGNTGSKEFLISGSRDKTLLIWDVNKEMDDGEELGKPKKMLKGHSHFIQELALSNDSKHCVTASWDSFVRMWDLAEGRSIKVFKGHKKDVLSVAFSSDNRQIISAGRDKSIMLWNTLGEAKHAIPDAHSEWVSSVKFSPDSKQNIFFSVGWDRKIKIWDKNMSEYAPKQPTVYSSHCLNALAVAPSGAFIATGGKDRILKVWSVIQETDGGYGLKLVRMEDLNSEVNTLAFSPNYFWVACGCEDSIKLYDFKSQKIISTIEMEPLDMKQEEPEEDRDEDKKKDKKVKKPRPKIGVLSMCMNPKGDMLYAGCTDNVIRVYELKEQDA